MKKERQAKFRTVMIQEQVAYLPKDWLANLKKIAKDYKGFQFAFIEHDKDLNNEGDKVKPHVHVMARFGSSAVVKSLTEWSEKL